MTLELGDKKFIKRREEQSKEDEEIDKGNIKRHQINI